MLPSLLSETFAQVVAEIRAQEFIALLDPIVSIGSNRDITNEEKVAFDKLVFSSYRALGKFENDPIATKILKEYEITSLFSEENLGDYIKSLGSFGHSSHLVQQQHVPRFAVLFRLNERLKALVFTMQLLRETITARQNLTLAPGEDVMRLEIIDSQTDGIRLNRFSVTFSELNDLVEQIDLLEETTTPARIGMIESGTPILLLIIGGVHLISRVTKMLSEMHELRLRYKYAELQLENDIIKGRLSIIKELQEICQKKEMEESDIKLLEHRIITSLKQIMDGGLRPEGLSDMMVLNQKLLNSESSLEKSEKSATRIDGPKEV
jgi:hypothetical protein